MEDYNTEIICPNCKTNIEDIDLNDSHTTVLEVNNGIRFICCENCKHKFVIESVLIPFYRYRE